MADTTADLDSFFEKKAKKKKGASGDRKKNKSNKADGNDASQSTPDTAEHDEWGVIQDDISKSVMMTVDTADNHDGGGVGNSNLALSPSDNMHTIAEETTMDGKEKQGPWNIISNQTENTGDNQPASLDTPIQPAAPTPTVSQQPVPDSTEPSSAPSQSRYVPPSLRNKQPTPAQTSGAIYLPPTRARPEVTVKPPNVQSQSDFPSLGGGAKQPSSTSQNPWQRPSVNS